MLIFFLLFTALFVFQAISSVVDISSVSAGSTIHTINVTNNTANIEQRQIRIFQQGMFNLDRALTPAVTAQDYVISLDLAGNYAFKNLSKTVTIEKCTFTGTLFGIENPAAMHEPQIQMKLDNIENFTVSNDFKTITFNTTFFDQNRGGNLTARVAGTLQFRNEIVLDQVLDSQDAIPNSSIMNATLGTIPLNPVKSSPGIEMNQISIS